MNTLELKDGYEYGPSDPDARRAFDLANEFIKREKDLKRFLITEPSVEGTEPVFQVHYRLLAKGDDLEAIVEVDTQTGQCSRIK